MAHNIAIFASGTGSNAKKIIEYLQEKNGSSSIHVQLIVSNRADAKVLHIAAEHHIPSLIINRKEFYQSEDILKIFNRYSIDFVVLAGFLWLIPSYLVDAYKKRIVNIHPALLPKYGGKGMYGMNVHRAVKEAGETETGITIHFVNEHYDEGAIIFQAKCPVTSEDTPEQIAQNVQQLEHRFFPRIIENTILGEVDKNG